jgi:hypothetical protein
MPSFRAFRMIARIGIPAARCRSSASSNGVMCAGVSAVLACHGLASNLTGRFDGVNTVAQCLAQNGVSHRRRSCATLTASRDTASYVGRYAVK